MFINCDRGSQFHSIRNSERLQEAVIEPSVGSVGDSYDHALAETINGLYKAEVTHRRGRWRNMEVVGYETLKWVDWINDRRLLETIGNILLAEPRKNTTHNSTKQKKQLNIRQQASDESGTVHSFINSIAIDKETKNAILDIKCCLISG